MADAAVLGELVFEFLDLRAGRDPTGTEAVYNFIDLFRTEFGEAIRKKCCPNGLGGGGCHGVFTFPLVLVISSLSLFYVRLYRRPALMCGGDPSLTVGVQICSS
jgi:hypothetical protein